MRNLQKLSLRKIVEPAEILRKKQMQNLWGGKRFCCEWDCTTSPGGATDGEYGQGYSSEECWSQAEAACPFPDYGIKIVDFCK